MSKTNDTTGIISKAAAPQVRPSSSHLPINLSTLGQGAASGESDESTSLSDSPLEQALHKLKSCDNLLRHLEGEIVRFRKLFMQPMNGGWGWKPEVFGDRAELDAEWQKLMQRRQRAFIQHQQAMREWAQEKMHGSKS